mmetsp:Transcript_12447/g.22485  ORF Transcript_12447/g.22485 Transcript_12447/m.22485 type:complete len:282 (+) Transcript_12447:1160-2005(+)
MKDGSGMCFVSVCARINLLKSTNSESILWKRSKLSRSCICMKTSDTKNQNISRRSVSILLGSVVGITQFLLLWRSPKLLSSIHAYAVSNRSIVNGVLSGYGLPQLPDVAGFSPLLYQFGDIVVQFDYPSSWIVSTVGESSASVNISSRMKAVAPLSVSDYRRAENATLYVSGQNMDWISIESINPSEIAGLILPGDATRSDAEFKLVRSKPLTDDNAYWLYEFLFTTITNSGYAVERKNLTAVTLIRNRLVALSASCSAPRWKATASNLQTCVSTFRAVHL